MSKGVTCYPEYADSAYFGIPLPAHWSAKNLSYLAKQQQSAFVDGPFGSDLKSSEYLDVGVPLIQLNNIRDGHHVLRNMKFVSEKKANQLSRHIARPADIVFAKMAEPVARSAMVSSDYVEYVIVADCVKMTPEPSIVDTQYLVWAINSDPVRIQAELVSTGTTRIRINLGELKKLKVPFPPLPEQTKIAAFLDHETAKIDGLIAKQERLIALLEEKRQAVISHAVTKGLDPTAPLRPSGIDWLGDVPSHWEVMALSRMTLDKCDGPFGSGLKSSHYTESGARVIRLQNIRATRFDNTSAAFIDIKYFEKSLCGHDVISGDLLFAGLGDDRNLVGRACVAPDGIEPALVKADCFRFRIDTKRFDPTFAAQQLSSTAVVDSKELSSGSTRSRIPLSIMASRKILVPPIGEQKIIARFIEEQEKRYGALFNKAQSAITLLKERRTALISAAVTGKIDLRDWQVPDATTAYSNQDITQNEEALA